MLGASDLFDRFADDFKSDDYILLDALATAAVIRYGRSFGLGIRSQLDIRNLPDVSAEDLDLHQHILAVRSKHAAHPVNMQETHSVMVGHRETDHGREVTVVSSSTLVATGISVDVANEASQLCLRWVDWLSAEKQLECERLLGAAQQLSSSELLDLPRGPVDVSRNPHKHRRQRR